jgi:glycosyltransferase involved in cell wall biosynthesis
MVTLEPFFPSTLQLSGHSLTTSLSKGRFFKKISVCMASYNGERYIAKQLRSILLQLSSEDEIIIVDDASRDQTRARIREFNDDRIRLIENNTNIGVARAFEEAIKRASGEIIFLSDQDDVWESDKVSSVLQAFNDHPDVRVIVTDAIVIDADDQPVGYRHFEKRGKFHPGILTNIIRNMYHGCTMSFRSTLLPNILPFPGGSGILHDAWIGIRNEMSGGATFYIDRPLIRYRRHSANASQPLTRSRQFKGRMTLLKGLCTFRRQTESARDQDRRP